MRVRAVPVIDNGKITNVVITFMDGPAQFIHRYGDRIRERYIGKDYSDWVPLP
jgi:hypothetical protein